MGFSFSEEAPLRGGIYVFTEESGSKIYINDELKDTTGSFKKEYFIQNLKPDEYLVVVTHDDYFPAAKYVTVNPQKVSALYPLLIPKDLSLIEVDLATTTGIISTTTRYYNKIEYAEILDLFAIATTTDLVSSSLASEKTQGKMKVWIEDTKIFAMWIGDIDRIPEYFCNEKACNRTLQVFDATKNIKTVEFYPGREDAILIAVENGIYALEIDTRRFQNFQVVFEGIDPDVRVLDDEVYVKEKSGELMVFNEL